MSLFLDVILYGLLFLFVWVSSFLWHELMHLAKNAFNGMIIVEGYSMESRPACLWAGGILSGAIFSIVGGLIWFLGAPAVGYLFLICGVVNLVYGVFETVFLQAWGNNQDYKLGRYSIYIGVTGTMVLLWMVFLQ